MGAAEPAESFRATFRATRTPVSLRTHQVRALAGLDRALTAEGSRAWVVLPPGAGKTLVGLEAIRRIGNKAVVFGPNTAIQDQWVRQWQAYIPATVPIDTERDLATPVTALTYQSLATFDPDDEIDEEGHDHLRPPGARRRRPGLLDRLHPNGRALVEALRTAGPLTLVLDECHHLLEVWGQLLGELLDLVPHARVLGLTATPPQTLSREQSELVEKLFGQPVYGTSLPAVVREGHLAPFAELCWLTAPTSRESDWLAAEAERFSELTTELVDPSFGSVPFLTWLDRRFVARTAGPLPGSRHAGGLATGAADPEPIPWHEIEKDEPHLATAALRMHHAGLVALPPGARLREAHRQRPTADDWVLLMADWVRHRLRHSDDPADAAVLTALRQALPSVGYQLTRSGIRAGRSPTDRVLARSEAKTHAAAEIVAAEHANLGDRLRMLLLCDHERATATLPATLRGVLARDAGSARLVLETLAGDPRTAQLDPVLVTGRTVAAGAATARALVAHVARHAPSVELDPIDPAATGVVEVTGRWTTRTWVRLITGFFSAGGCKVLVGTRGLLGEGWDAARISGLVDLTSATTPTAVVQTRGRAVRTDPSWPDKVAVTWSVVCATADHPKGDADWKRFVRKHDGYFCVDEYGEIVDGVAHVDHRFTPNAPPGPAEFAAFNAAMLARSENRPRIRALWNVGEPYADHAVHTVRVRAAGPTPAEAARAVAEPVDGGPAVGGLEPPGAVAGPSGAVPVRATSGVGRPAAGALAGVLAAILVLILAAQGWLAAGVGLVVCTLVWHALALRGADRHRTAAARPVDVMRFAYAVADGLRGAGLSPVGAEAVGIRIEPDGEYRIALTGVAPAVSEQYALALDDALAPIGAPRYVIPRHVLPPASGWRRVAAAYDQLLRTARTPVSTTWHAVPAVFGVNAGTAAAYATGWRRWVSAGDPLYTASPEGTGVVAAHRGAEPFDAAVTLRVAWT